MDADIKKQIDVLTSVIETLDDKLSTLKHSVSYLQLRIWKKARAKHNSDLKKLKQLNQHVIKKAKELKNSTPWNYANSQS